MKISYVTMFPEYFKSSLNSPINRRAEERKICSFSCVDIREFADGSFRHIDDSPYGGGPGMILKCPPVVSAIRSCRDKDSHVVMLDPAGTRLNQKKVRELAQYRHLVLVCGHYEGFDARIYNEADEMISVGDYILSGGEPAAVILTDAITRLLDGTLRKASTEEESFESMRLEYPQYTKPYDFVGDTVPDILRSGDHEKIRKWRIRESLRRTKRYRPDLFEKYPLTEEESRILAEEELNKD